MPAIPTNAKLLLHMDGTDASTTFTDSSGTSKSVTAAGNAQIDTAQYKFATGSGLFDGTGDYLSTADSADFNLGSGDFTLSVWLRFNAKPAGDGHMDIFAQGNPAVTGFRFYFYTADGTNLEWNMTANGGTGNIQLSKACNTISLNTWYHFEVDRSGNNFYSFQDGVQIGTTVTDSDTMPDATTTAYIGCYYNTTERFFNGWMDELILVKGTALHTANFTPETLPYGTLPPSGFFSFF